MKQLFTKNVLGLAVVILVCLFMASLLFQPIFLNLSSQLYDWNDYPLMVWIMDQHLDHLWAGQWQQVFQSNMFYSFKDSLLFSDLLLPSTVLAAVFSVFTPDRILTFNLVFFVTWALNGVAAFDVWRRLFKGPQLYLATFFTVFLPFVIINLSHFQLISLWPFLFGFAQLVENKKTLKQALTLGIWISITFVSSVYLAIFLLYCVGIWAGVQFLADWLRPTTPTRAQPLAKWKTWLGWGSVVLLAIALLAGPFVYRYFAMKQYYSAARSYGEYVSYSAGLLDYLSTASYGSLLYSLGPVQKWNGHIQASMGGLFPGFVLLGLAAGSLVFITQKKPLRWGIGVPINRQTVFFALLLLSGLLFSFGPRAKIGAAYSGIPLPYAVLLKFVPLFEPIRATVRWSLLFYVGLVFFAVLGFGNSIQKAGSKVNGKKAGMFGWLAMAVVLGAYSIEVLPWQRSLEPANSSARQIDAYLADFCKEKAVLLEYPFMYNPYGDARGIVMMLQHWTSMILDATAHECVVVNGYSGFSPTAYNEYSSVLTSVMNTESVDQQEIQVQQINDMLSQRQVELFRVHTQALSEAERATFEHWLAVAAPVILHQTDGEVLLQLAKE